MKNFYNKTYFKMILLITGLVLAFAAAWQYAVAEKGGVTGSYIAEHGTWYMAYTVLVVLLASAACITGYIGIFRSDSSKKRIGLFLTTMLLLGGLTSVTMVPLCVPDEPTHYNNSLYVSNTILSKFGQDGITTEEDVAVKPFGKEDYIYEFWHDEVAADEYLEIKGTEKTEQMPLYPYFLPGFVLTLLRPFFSHEIYITVTRIVNLMLFALISILCMKLCPRLKYQILAVSLLPAVIWITCSFSYDCLNLALANLFLCYCIYCHDKESVSIWNLLALVVIIALMAPTKYIYAVMVLFALIIPKDKIQIKHKRIITIAGLVVISAVAVMVVSTRVSEVMYLLQGGMDNRAGGDATQGYTLGYVIRNPIEMILVYFKTVIEYSEEYILKSVCGDNFSEYVPPILKVILLVMFLVIMSCAGSDGLTRKDRIVTWGTYIIMVLMIFTSFLFLFSYIPGTDEVGTIGGVQGRYFMPMMLMLPFMLAHGKNNVTETTKRVLIFALLYLNLIITFFKYTGTLLDA